MKNLFFALLVVLGSTVSANAGTVTEFVKVENGLFNDVYLAGFSTYAMRVTADTDWTSVDMKITLDSGSLRHIPPGFLGSYRRVGGFGDTAGLGATNTLGSITDGFNGTIGFAGGHTETPASFISSWFTPAIDDIGTFDVGMITISNDANGTILFRTIAGVDVEEGGFTIGTTATHVIRNGAILGSFVLPMPEPSTLALASLSLIGLFVRRHRS